MFEAIGNSSVGVAVTVLVAAVLVGLVVWWLVAFTITLLAYALWRLQSALRGRASAPRASRSGGRA